MAESCRWPEEKQNLTGARYLALQDMGYPKGKARYSQTPKMEETPKANPSLPKREDPLSLVSRNQRHEHNI